MRSTFHLVAGTVALAILASPGAGQPAAPKGHVTGIGGVFVRSKDAAALMRWYRDMLGIALEPWGGAALRYDAPAHPPVVVLNALGANSDYIKPSPREFMLNFAVDDLAALLDRLKAKGVTILGESKDDPSGRFAWIMDPDGTKIELWQPAPEPAAK